MLHCGGDSFSFCCLKVEEIAGYHFVMAGAPEQFYCFIIYLFYLYYLYILVFLGGGDLEGEHLCESVRSSAREPSDRVGNKFCHLVTTCIGVLIAKQISNIFMFDELNFVLPFTLLLTHNN